MKHRHVEQYYLNDLGRELMKAVREIVGQGPAWSDRQKSRMHHKWRWANYAGHKAALDKLLADNPKFEGAVFSASPGWKSSLGYRGGYYGRLVVHLPYDKFYR